MSWMFVVDNSVAVILCYNFIPGLSKPLGTLLFMFHEIYECYEIIFCFDIKLIFHNGAQAAYAEHSCHAKNVTPKDQNLLIRWNFLFYIAVFDMHIYVLPCWCPVSLCVNRTLILTWCQFTQMAIGYIRLVVSPVKFHWYLNYWWKIKLAITYHVQTLKVIIISYYRMLTQ